MMFHLPITYRDGENLLDSLRLAEEAVAGARRDFVRLRNSVDTAGELALCDRALAAERALESAIRRVDELVYPAEPLPERE